MAGEWRLMTLGKTIELKRGYDLPSRDRRNRRFPIVSSSGISGRHAESKAKFIPLRLARELGGSLRGMATDIVRDTDRL